MVLILEDSSSVSFRGFPSLIYSDPSLPTFDDSIVLPSHSTVASGRSPSIYSSLKFCMWHWSTTTCFNSITRHPSLLVKLTTATKFHSSSNWIPSWSLATSLTQYTTNQNLIIMHTLTVPVFLRPVSRSRNVVLPHPEGPMIPTISPGLKKTDTPSKILNWLASLLPSGCIMITAIIRIQSRKYSKNVKAHAQCWSEEIHNLVSLVSVMLLHRCNLKVHRFSTIIYGCMYTILYNPSLLFWCSYIIGGSRWLPITFKIKIILLSQSFFNCWLKSICRRCSRKTTNL